MSVLLVHLSTNAVCCSRSFAAANRAARPYASAMARTYSPREMIDALVALPTVSRDSNLELIHFVQDYLEGHGIASRLVASDCGAKANLYASIGPEVEGGVVLSGHTDVVPVDGQPWSSDPFVVTERDGKLFGRGTCDMKGFCAIALSLVPQMTRLTRPIHLAFSYDEEVGCVGAPSMIERLKAELPEPAAVIVGEPTSMQAVTSHKGIFHFDTFVRGFEVHSSQQHRGVSAVMVAAELINWLADRQRRNAEAANPDCLMEPPFTTLHCGTVAGGTAHNITARDCQFVTDIRSLPEECPLEAFEEFAEHCREVVEPRLKAIAPSAGISFEQHAHVPGFRVDENEPAVALVRELTGANSCQEVAYAAEAGQFQQAGFSTVICGPGSIDQAHQPDEYISLDQVEAGTVFLEKLIARLSQA